MQQTGRDGWTTLTETDGLLDVLAAVQELDATATYTEADLAAAADVPMKQLYLSDAVSTLVEMGVLAAVESEGASEYRIRTDSHVFEQAAALGAAVGEELS